MSSVAILLTSLARRAATAEEELPYAAQKEYAYSYCNNRNCNILPSYIATHTSHIVMWYAIQANTQAIPVLSSAEPTAHRQFSSDPMAIIVAMQGR